MSKSQAPDRSFSDTRHAMTVRITASYSIFLLLALFMSIYIYNSNIENSKNVFWNQNKNVLQSSISLLDNDFLLFDTYSRQVMQNSSFTKLVHFTSNTKTGYYLTAMQTKSGLSSHIYSYQQLPLNNFFIYIKNTDYVLLVNQFESSYLYYYGDCKYPLEQYEQWLATINSGNGSGTLHYMEGYANASAGDYYTYMIDLDTLTYKSMPAVICFNLNMKELLSTFQGLSLDAGSYLYVTDADGNEMLTLGICSTADEVLRGFSNLTYKDDYATLKDTDGMKKITRLTSSLNDWNYYLVQPVSLSNASSSDYRIFFLVFILLATILGILLIILMLREHIRPLVQLDEELQVAITDKEQMQVIMDSQRPMICNSYVRQLMLGNILSDSEISYVSEYLGLADPNLHFQALYIVAYHNDDLPHDETDTQNLIRAKLREYFSIDDILYLFSPAEHAFVMLLYHAQSENDSLITIQDKVLKIHNELLSQNAIWLYAGIGLSCTSLSNVWESYQQAQDAASYTAKNYIFLPYEMIKKDSNVFYYPNELSTKLIHFITSGNKPQVMELFSLIHQENIEERSLPINLLKYLLSDIRNTLLKARFSLNATSEETKKVLDTIDIRFDEHLSFKLCEDIALSLCTLFTPEKETEDLITTIERYIKKNYRDPSLCLSKISDEFQISESYFSHMFKKNAGVNFSVYLEDIRLNEAAELMQKPDCNLSTLYMEVGYNNENSFRRAFKKKFNITPSAMKQTN